MRVLFLLTTTLMLATAADSQVPEAKGQASWKEYTYANDGFAITLPSEPTPHKDAQLPDLQINVYTSGGVTLRVEVASNGCDSAISTQAEMIEEFRTGRRNPILASGLMPPRLNEGILKDIRSLNLNRLFRIA